MEVRAFIRDLARRGVSLRIDGDQLRVRGKIDEDTRALIRRDRDAIVEELQQGDELIPWDQLRALARFLGQRVIVDGRSVRLWGITPRGAIIESCGVLITVDVKEVSVS